ncbi:hypothetical protein, partial [[Muricauda] lutisoli]
SIGGAGTPNQTVEVAISGGTNALVDIRDGDSDPTNENQTVSASTGISVSQTGQDFQVTNTAPDQTVSLADGGNGNVTIGGAYPNFTIDVPDNTDSQNLSIGGAGTPNQTVEVAISGGTNALVDIRDGDSDPTNENQTVSAGNGMTVTPSGQDFEVAVTNPVIAMGRFGLSGSQNTVGSSISTIGSGQYRVTLTSTPLPADYIVQLTILNPGTPGPSNFRTIQVIDQTANYFDVQVYNSSGSAAPSDWYYTVTAF